MRHATAMPIGDTVRRDEDRPLSIKGKLRTRRAAQGMRQIGIRWDRILSSPLLRARQTAQVVVETYGWPLTRLEDFAALRPGGNHGEILAMLAGQKKTARILLVGHEPDMSHLASTLLTGSPTQLQSGFKKGGICRIDADRLPPKGRGVLRFFLMPKHMRGWI